MEDTRLQRGDDGCWTSDLSEDDFIDAVGRIDMPGTADVADEVGCKQPTAYKYLTSLYDDGLVESKQVGKSLVWSVTEDAQEDST